MRAVSLISLVGWLALGCELPRSFRQPWFTDTAEGQLFRSHCTSCHRMLDPEDRTQHAWSAAVDKFSSRAHLTDEESARLRVWLMTHASDAPKPEQEPVGVTPGVTAAR